MSVEAPLDSSAHIRIEQAVGLCVTHAGPLYSRVQAAYGVILPIIFEKFGPQSTQLMQALQLNEAHRVEYIDGYGAHFGRVPWRTLKRWLMDLTKLYAWPCFLRGDDAELKSWLSNS